MSAIAAVALTVCVLAVLCAPLSPLFDPDEGYYPATAAESLRSGSFWDPRFNAAPRWDKPILSYALIEGGLLTFGHSAFAARIPSAVEGAVLVAMIGILVARMASARAAILSATIAGTTLGVSIFSKVAHPELALVASVTTAELLLGRCLIASHVPHLPLYIAAGVAMGLGILAKGPVAVVLPGLAVICVLPFLTLPRTGVGPLLRGLLLSLVVAGAVALPWYLAMTARHGTGFLHVAVWQQNVGRYTSGAYGHGLSPASLLLSVLVAMFPWTGLLPHALGGLSVRARGDRDVLRATMVASAVTALAFYSLSSSKLPSYVLVAVPPLAVVIALWLDEELDRPHSTPGAWMPSTALLVFTAGAFLSLPLWIDQLMTARRLFGGMRPEHSGLSAYLAPVTVAVGALLTIAVFLFLTTRRALRRVAVLAILGASIPVVVLMSARPILASMYPWDTIGPRIDGHPGDVWLVGRRAPSLTFYARRTVTLLPSREFVEPLVQKEPQGWLVLTREDWNRFASTLAATQAHATAVAEGGRMVLIRFDNQR